MLPKNFILTCFLIFRVIKCDEQPSIVIIGAGPAGIAAATRLLKNNFTNIKILEAKNRIGGRINSVKFGDAYVDLGAEFCHGEKDNVVYSMVKDLDILRHTELNYQFIDSDGKIIDKRIQEDLFEFLENMDASNLNPELKKNCQHVKSAGECFKINYNSSFANKYSTNEYNRKIMQGLFHYIKSYVSSYDSNLDWNDLLLESEYKKCDGDLFLNWNGLGYKTILEVMMQRFPKGQHPLPMEDKILLNKEVITISNWNTSRHQNEVKLQDGTTLSADHVIITTSAGVLKANFDNLFDPQLPTEKIAAIKNVGFGAIDKVVLHFPKRWWQNDSIWTFIWTPEDRETLENEFPQGLTKSGKPWLTYLVGLTPAENNPKVLIAWYAGDVIPEFEQLSDDVVLEGHKHILHRFLGEHLNVSDPDEILRSKWLSDPHFRGTYSYESVKGHSSGGSRFAEKLATPLLNEEGKPSILFAGEATHSTYFSTVHGAIESGYREADRIINLHS